MPWFPGDVSGLSAEGPGPWLRMFQNAPSGRRSVLNSRKVVTKRPRDADT